MSLLKRLRVLAAKVEGTIGTAETLAGADGAFNAYNVMAQANIPMENREAQGSMEQLAAISGGRTGTLSFRCDMGYDGVTVPTWASAMLPACGLVNAAGVFTPRSEAPGANVKTLTIASYQDGMRKILAGAVGNAVITLPTGRMGYIDFTFTGVWQAPTDVAIIAPTYPTAKALRFASGTATYNEAAMKLEQMTFDFGNTVVLREDPATASGFIAGIITDRIPTATANPEAVRVTTQNLYDYWITHGEYELEATLAGPNASSIVINAPKAQLMNVQEGDRNQLIVDDLSFQLNKNAANLNQCFSITFNATP